MKVLIQTTTNTYRGIRITNRTVDAPPKGITDVLYGDLNPAFAELIEIRIIPVGNEHVMRP